jgi:hypothetical protein
MEQTDKNSKSRKRTLPVISEETLDGVHHVYAGKKWGKHLEEVKQQVLKENPNLVKFIEQQVSRYPTALHNALFEIAIGTLAVLDLQIQVSAKQKLS